MQRAAYVLDGVVLVAIAVLCGFGILLSHATPEVFEEVYVAEDRGIEWMTTMALVAGAGLCLYRFIRLRRSRERNFLLVTLLLGLAFAFGAGEEISWGQRLLRVQSPEFFRAHNAQQEMNVHNLIVGDVKLNRLVFSNLGGVLLAVYLVALPMMYERSPRLSAWVESVGLPVLQVRHMILGVLLIVSIQFGSNSSKRWELLEFGMSSLMVVGMWNPRNVKLFDPTAPQPTARP